MIIESKEKNESERKQLKMNGYNGLKRALDKFDEYTNKDSGVTLTKFQINIKCVLLSKLSLLI